MNRIAIEVRRFPVTLRDERTKDIMQESIILDKQRLRAAQLKKEVLHEQ